VTHTQCSAATEQERCPSCFGTDDDFRRGLYKCSDPWHADDHLRAKTLARRTIASVLPRSEGQGSECDGGLHTSNEPQSAVWQPIETAPKDGTPVIIAERTDLSNGSTNWYIDTAVNYYETDIRSKDVWFEREGSEVVCDEPTHWQPLPTPPVSRPQ
jgi:hypothetical protein